MIASSLCDFPSIARATRCSMHLNNSIMRDNNNCGPFYTNSFTSVETPDMLKGVIELDCDAKVTALGSTYSLSSLHQNLLIFFKVARTKNVRDRFEYCIRIDAPNAAKRSVPVPTKVKRWTKLVMALATEPEMTAWIDAIRWTLRSAGGATMLLQPMAAVSVHDSGETAAQSRATPDAPAASADASLPTTDDESRLL
jgi:hypothetical protein